MASCAVFGLPGHAKADRRWGKARIAQNTKKNHGSKVKTDRSLFILWSKWLEGEERSKQGWIGE